MATIHLIRPGTTDYQEKHRLQGTLEMPLNEAGTRRIAAILRRLPVICPEPDALFSCPADPCTSTAHLIASAYPKLRVREIEELQNVDQGLWQGLAEDEVRRRYSKVFRVGRERPQDIVPPGGETLVDACRRLAKPLRKIIRKHASVILVAAEPLATVISCTLQNRRICVSECLSGVESPQDIETIEADLYDDESFAAQRGESSDEPADALESAS